MEKREQIENNANAEKNSAQGEVCPCCENHCPKEQLKCLKGMEHFGIKADGKNGPGPGGRGMQNLSEMKPEDAVIMLMRQCGHYLHHNVGHGGAVDTGKLLEVLSEEEKQQLIALLKKCVEDWQK